LYFLCGYDHSRIEYGIVLEKNKDWVKKVAPALKIGLFLARIGLKVGCNVSLPFPDWLKELGVEGVLTDNALHDLGKDVDESLQELDKLLETALEKDSNVQELFAEAQRVSAQAYQEIAALARADLKWSEEMKQCGCDGGLVWVKTENYPAMLELSRARSSRPT
jgi:hypothetical protein